MRETGKKKSDFNHTFKLSVPNVINYKGKQSSARKARVIAAIDDHNMTPEARRR